MKITEIYDDVFRRAYDKIENHLLHHILPIFLKQCIRWILPKLKINEDSKGDYKSSLDLTKDIAPKKSGFQSLRKTFVSTISKTVNIMFD